MRKIGLLIALVLMIGFQINCQNDNKNNVLNTNIDNKNKIDNTKILKQNKGSREFTHSALKLVANISLRDNKTPLYRPTYLKYDKYGAIYIMDFSNYSIHKFITSKVDRMYDEHKIFLNEHNQNQGKLKRVLDFKIFKDVLYVVKEGFASIDKYSINGTLLKIISIGNIFPMKIAVIDGSIIVQSRYLPGHLFKMYDMEGNIIHEYGDYVDRSNLDSAIYHDNAISDSFGDGYYYYLPYYLGFVALYHKDQLQYARETIDGLGKKAEAIEKTVMEKYKVKTITKKYETATMYAVLKDYLLIKASDIENETSYWDLYDLYSNEYLITIKDHPKTRFFDVWNNNLACVDDTNLKIFDMGAVLLEAASHKEKK